jgi:ubiquinone/menaquinone biosynthesis C-methylase UbiE/uncharacterized protein YbaR (Trm112 family)
MTEDVLERLRCPACGGALRAETLERDTNNVIKTGFAVCCLCSHWYPIEEYLLELLPDDLAYVEDRRAFWLSHRAELEACGLSWRELGAERGKVEAQLKQQSHFDWYAANSQQTYSSYEQMPFWRAVDEKVFAQWRKEIKPGGWLLDVGCAQGRSALGFMSMPITILGFDISKALVRQAIASYRAGDNRAAATFFVGDGSMLPVVDGTFDYVLIYGVLHHLPDPGRTCREVARVLKSGGIYFGSENNQSIFRKVFETLMKVIPLWHEEAGAQPLIGDEKIRSWFDNSEVTLETSTRVFIPPHLVNLLGSHLGAALLNVTDRVGRSVPFLRDNGGLIMLRAVKR